MTKTIEKLMEKAATKGYAKNGAWEVEQVQDQFIRIKHYGTCILKVDYTVNEHENRVQANSTSVSDSRVINDTLRYLNLYPYKNTEKDFKKWFADHPLLTNEYQHEYQYKEPNQNYYVHEGQRKDWENKWEEFRYEYIYDEEWKTFRNR